MHPTRTTGELRGNAAPPLADGSRFNQETLRAEQGPSAPSFIVVAAMENAPFWFPVVTLVVGAVVGYLADYLREGRSAERQREAGRRAFERETLLELQDALAMLGRFTSRVHFEDSQAAEPGLVSNDASDGFAEAARNVTRLKVRLPDELLRSEVEEFVDLCGSVALPSPSDEGRAEQTRDLWALSRTFIALNERLGAKIRDL